MPSRQLEEDADAGRPPDPSAAALLIPPPVMRPPRHRLTPRFVPPIVAAALGFSLFVVFAAALLCLWRRKKRRPSRNKTAPSSPLSSTSDPKKLPRESEEPQPRRFTYDQLRRATASFASANKLGQGGFGPVFRGALPSGEEIAVKLMDSGSLQGEIEFQNELSLAATMLRPKAAAENGEEPYQKHVVFPLGFCSEDVVDGDPQRERRRRKRREKRRRRRKKKSWIDGIEEDEDDDDEEDREGGEFGIGSAAEELGRRRVRLLVYELIRNGSLQDALLIRKRPELMDWGRRFAVLLDVARGLQFLHLFCDPPIVHGDIKPSNVLLDTGFSARIADFGLARMLARAPASPPMAENDESNVADLIGSDGAVLIAVGGEDNESTTAAETESTYTAGGSGFVAIEMDPEGRGSPGDDGCVSLPAEGEGASPDISPMRFEVASASEIGGFDKMSVDSVDATGGGRKGYLNKTGSHSGKDWWWRQDVDGRSEPATSVKDYVMEWIGSEVKKERPKANWVASEAAVTASSTAAAGAKKGQQRDWWAFLDEERRRKKEKARRPREWWREEFCDELVNKSRKKQITIVPKSKGCTIGGVLSGDRQWWSEERQWWEREPGTPLDRKKQRKKSWSRGSRASADWPRDGQSGELRLAGRRISHDWTSGDIPKSGGISSTPSMRGTVCYSAPECAVGGPELVSEKCDIYSFGVLVLVIVSGRRPLQVTASPMSEFERANLISWARHLAHRGNLLDLLDKSLHGVDREQALLCITVALLCLQRAPSRRPSIKEVVGMLTGDLDPPHLPLEYSPSPPGTYPFKSRRKAR